MSALPRVLLVDGSRAARAAISRALQADYEWREEADGEAAWQALVLDHAIRAVVSVVEMPRMNGYQLLERVRASRLPRLQQMPFVLLADDDVDGVRGRAGRVSDVLTAKDCATELRIRLNRLLAKQAADEPAAAAQTPIEPLSGLLSRQALELQVAQALSHSARHNVPVSLMVLAFDRYERLGEATGEVVQRFARLLAGKIRREDSLGLLTEGQFAIVSPGITQIACITFAERVRAAIAQARLSIAGQALQLTASVGVAAIPDDSVRSAGDFLRLASERMQAAAAAGGNRLQAGIVETSRGSLTVSQALDLLANGRGAAVRPHLGSLGRQCLPLLKLLDDELGLALPLAEIERRFNERECK